MRTYKGRIIELLAPAGTFSDFEEIIESRCDAVYLGGKAFNMRSHKKSRNFSDEELALAINKAHERGKKVYVTLNAMLNDEELDEVGTFLKYLDALGPDGLIVADMGLVKLVKELGIQLDLHLSVMANVHSGDMVKSALEFGATRVVMSREMPLHAVSELVANCPEMEYEYFIHGDMCSVNGAQCLLSGTTFGKSSNRGACMKPCRWNFEKDGHVLAVKDMAMYRHLPELINSGVNSFKIEGRMRDAMYLTSIINAYGEAIDRYLQNPGGYWLDEKAAQALWKDRVRDFSTAYSFKVPGAGNITFDGAREPRVFSLPAGEGAIYKEEASLLQRFLQDGPSAKKPLLTVSVNGYEAARAAIAAGADCLYLNGETFRPEKPWSLTEIEELSAEPVQIYYRLPRMANKRQLDELERFVLHLQKSGAKGLLVSDFGQIRRFKNSGLELIGDYGLNVYNCRSADFYQTLGLSRVLFSIEATAQVLKGALKRMAVPLEVAVHGAPTLMYMDHCVIAAKHGLTSQDWCHGYCLEEGDELIDEKGNSHRLKADRFCKNHLLPGKDLCLLPVAGELKRLGVAALFIEGRHEEASQLKKIVALYRRAIDAGLDLDEALDQLKELESHGAAHSFLGFARGI